MDKISKRATIGAYQQEPGAANELVRKYITTVWSPKKGFFENSFKTLTYVAPFFGGIGGAVPLILSSLGSYLLGVGVGDLGRAVDNVLGTGPGMTPGKNIAERLESLLDSAINKKMSSEAHTISQREIIKTAGIFSTLLRNGKVASTVAKFIGKFLMMIPGIFAVATIDDFLQKVTEPIRTEVTGDPQGYIGGEEPQLETNTKDNDLDSLLNSLEEKYGI